jgi:hypothetical protein
MSSYDVLPLNPPPLFRRPARGSLKRRASAEGQVLWAVAGMLVTAAAFACGTGGVVVLIGGPMCWMACRRAPAYLGAMIGGGGLFFPVAFLIAIQQFQF